MEARFKGTVKPELTSNDHEFWSPILTSEYRPPGNIGYYFGVWLGLTVYVIAMFTLFLGLLIKKDLM